MLPPDRLVKGGVLLLPCVGDGRQSGTSASPSILNASPEAAVGGGLALLETGDKVRVDIGKRTANILITDEELAKRKAAWKPHIKESQTPWQELQRKFVGQLASAPASTSRSTTRRSPRPRECRGTPTRCAPARAGRWSGYQRKSRCSTVTGRSARLISTIAHGEVGGARWADGEQGRRRDRRRRPGRSEAGGRARRSLGPAGGAEVGRAAPRLHRAGPS